MIRKAVDIICLASYIMNKETRNWLKTEQDKANHILTTKCNVTETKAKYKITQKKKN